jgi:hypothetical protein
MLKIIFILLFTKVAYADLIYKNSLQLAGGEYKDFNFSEIRLGASLHTVQYPFAFELHGFRRVVREADDFYGLDFEIRLKRQFALSKSYLVGTFIGPGYRFASNEFDAPLIDFSLAISKLQKFSFHIGYKIILLDWASRDYDNDNLIYIGIQI